MSQSKPATSLNLTPAQQELKKAQEEAMKEIRRTEGISINPKTPEKSLQPVKLIQNISMKQTLADQEKNDY